MIKIGTVGFPINKKRYQSYFNLVEIDQFLTKIPRITTVERWKAALPPQFEYVISAPRSITHASPRSITHTSAAKNRMEHPGRTPSLAFSDSAVVRKAFSDILQAAQILGAKTIFFELPANAIPAPEQIGRIQAFFKTLPQNELSMAWQPPYHWPASLVDRLSKSLRLVPAFNPLSERPAPKGPFQFLRINRISKREGFSSLTDQELSRIKSACQSRLSYVIFNHGPHAFKDALRFSTLCRHPL